MKLDIDFHKIDLPAELMQICGVAAACVYAVLRAESDENGICELSRNEIARRTGLKNRIIPDLIVKLEALGIVERHYNPGYATSYLVKEILTAEQPEPEKVRAAAEPARQSEQQSSPGLKPGYKYYGEYGWIALKDDEYKELVHAFGKANVDRIITTIDNNRESNKMYNRSIHHGEYGKAYILEWIRKDNVRIEQANNHKKKTPIKKIGQEHPTGFYGDTIKEQEMNEIHQYLDLVNVFPEDLEEEKKRMKEELKRQEYMRLVNRFPKGSE